MTIADLYWIDRDFPGRLAVAPRPRGGERLEDEILSFRRQGVDCVICLLEDDEIAELSLADEVRLCTANGIAFERLAIADRSLRGSNVAAARLVQGIAGRLRRGDNVLIHCRAGIGRTGLVAACGLISLGLEADEALAAIGLARRVQVPDTQARRDWIFAFAKSRGEGFAS